MRRQHDAEKYELTDAEKRDVIKLINEDKPLPEKYRFILFEDKREVELVWNGKTREVSTAILPFQTLEHIDEPREETGAQEEAQLFDTRGRQLKGWTNKLISGDNKLILSSLKSGRSADRSRRPAASSSSTLTRPSMWARTSAWTSRSAARRFTKSTNLLEQIAYRDTWGLLYTKNESFPWNLDRRIHFRERMSKFPHAQEPRSGIALRPAHIRKAWPIHNRGKGD